MKGIWQDLRYGARSLMRTPGFTAVAVITLALGIGANTAIFTIVNAVLLRPLPYPESERLMLVGRTLMGAEADPELSQPKFVFLRDNVQSFEALTASQEPRPTGHLSDENQTDYVRTMMVSADFFHVLGVRPAIGRVFTPSEDSPAGERVVIISDGLWRRRFGADANMIDRTITINGVANRVVGIMPPDFEFLGPRDVFIPMRTDPTSKNEGHNYTVIGRLKQGVTEEQARSELKTLFDEFKAAHPQSVKENESFGLTNWRAKMTSGVRELLWILLGAVGFVLLIACTNIANLQLTRAMARRKEMAIRIAMGAGAWRLIRQLLVEGLILALVGGLMGFVLARWGVDAMLALAPEGVIPRAGEVNLDWRVLAFTMGASLLTGVIFGLAPGLQTLRVDVNHALKEGAGRTGAGGRPARLRGVLVAVEVALALSLTIGAGLLLRTFSNLRQVKTGFEADHVLTLEVSPRGKSYDTVAKINDLYRRALETLRDLPGVEAVALTNKLPLDAQFNLPYRLASQRDYAAAAQYRLISPDYFRVMKMNVIKGRQFEETDRGGAERVVIVNEAFARLNFADVDPLGQPLFVCCEDGDRAMHRVVGVVNDTKQKSLGEPEPAAIFIPLEQAGEAVRPTMQQTNLVLRTAGDPSLLGDTVQREWRRLDPNVPLRNVRPMEELVSRAVAPQRFNLFLMGMFAALGFLLAALGIYGVQAYSVSQRTNEIGLRMALGAQSRDVLKLIMKQGMRLAVVGMVIGLIASFALTRVIKSLLFNVSATDVLTFIVVSLVFTSVALLACWIPARRATKVDPLVALRYE
ncbi:MAG TPA: ABC transporter permease [Blastocatellia bacterium]|nr:ABC transporter permease [Blastocatellia bacterium]